MDTSCYLYVHKVQIKLIDNGAYTYILSILFFCVYINSVIIVYAVYAQVLQAIGNLAQEMDQKEEYMRCMYSLVQSNMCRLKEFVQQLVQVDQKEGNVKSLKW